MSPPNERPDLRADKRIVGGFVVRVLARGRIIAQGTSLELSPGSIGLRLPYSLPIGSKFDLELCFGERGTTALRVSATTAHVRPGLVVMIFAPEHRNAIADAMRGWLDGQREESTMTDDTITDMAA